MERRDLLELLYTARERYTSLQVAWQYHYDDDAMKRVLERWSAQQPPGSTAAVHAEAASAPPAQRRSTTLRRRVWWQKPGCWRDEMDTTTGGSMQTILCDDQWWSFLSGTGTLYTNVTPLDQWKRLGLHDVRTATPPTLESRIDDVPLLDPSFLLASHALEPLETVQHVGRKAVRVRATYRKGKDRLYESIFWATADEYELWVDAEYGILLRYSATLAGHEFAVASVDHVVFNAAIPDDVFTFHPLG